MRIDQLIADAEASRGLDKIAAEAGVPRADLDVAVTTLVQGLADHLERNTLSRGGLADLVAALGDPHHARRLDNARLFDDEAVRADGNAILGHIVGTKDASRALAAEAARASGISEQLIKMLLPYIASLLMAALQRWLGGGLGDIMKRLPQPAPGGGGGGRLPRDPAGGGSEGGYGRGFELPQQGPIDGLPGGSPFPGEGDRPPPVGRPAPPQQPFPGPGRHHDLPEQSPLPLPGENRAGERGNRGRNPFDDLSDILRRSGGGLSPAAGSPWSVVRNAIGGALGFAGRGVIGWIVRLIIVRFGWRIVRRLLGGLAGGR